MGARSALRIAYCAYVKRLDTLQIEHSQLFARVAEYSGLRRPKHHFMTHLALDVWRFGPPRGYWCFGFEGYQGWRCSLQLEM